MIFKHSNFDASSFGHGGERRSAQIEEILRSRNISFKDITLPRISVKLFLSYLHILVYDVIKLFPWKINTSKVKLYIFELVKSYSIANNLNLNNEDVFIWESTYLNRRFILKGVKRSNARIVAVPHNLESLVPTQKSPFTDKISPFWLDEEIKMLKHCDLVVTISREEQWLLELHGIATIYLPYFPTKQVYDFLIAIKQKREVSERQTKHGFIILGTAVNPPTFLGITKLLNFLEDCSLPENTTINVIGFGSEKIKENMKKNDNVKIIGTVSNEELSHYLETTKGVIIHGAPSSGALTKIPELLIAGVPVLVNETAARSYFNYSGVYIYHNGLELLDLLSSELSPPGAFDCISTYEDQFVERLKKFSSSCS